MRGLVVFMLCLFAFCCLAECGVRNKRHWNSSGHPLPNEDLINSIFQIPIGVLKNVGNVLKTALGMGTSDSGSSDSSDADSNSGSTENPAKLVSQLTVE